VRALPFLLILLLVVPSVAAHGNTQDDSAAYLAEQRQRQQGGSVGSAAPLDTAPPVAGYTGPGREPYISFFEGVWLYGQESATPLANQSPRHLATSGDWVVWEDAARSDIYLYSISAGSGYYITKDAALQRNPAISGNVVVWKDYRNGNRPDIWAYQINTTRTWRVSIGPGAHRNPSINGDIVAWEDDRSQNADVYGANLTTGRNFAIANTTVWHDREIGGSG